MISSSSDLETPLKPHWATPLILVQGCNLANWLIASLYVNISVHAEEQDKTNDPCPSSLACSCLIKALALRSHPQDVTGSVHAILRSTRTVVWKHIFITLLYCLSRWRRFYLMYRFLHRLSSAENSSGFGISSLYEVRALCTLCTDARDLTRGDTYWFPVFDEEAELPGGAGRFVRTPEPPLRTGLQACRRKREPAIGHGDRWNEASGCFPDETVGIKITMMTMLVHVATDSDLRTILERTEIPSVSVGGMRHSEWPLASARVSGTAPCFCQWLPVLENGLR